MPGKVIEIAFERRRGGVLLRCSGGQPVEAASKDEALERAAAWLEDNLEAGTVVQVRCGSRLVGMASRFDAIASLLRRALWHL